MRSRVQRDLLVLAAYLGLTALLTWPLFGRFFTELGGDPGDPWQTVWRMWWFHEAIVRLHQNPFWSSYVHWPLGMPLVFETSDLTDCLLALPLWSFLPPVAVHNCAVSWAFVLGGFFFYRFALELTGREAASFLAGALFTFGPFHFGHALGHLHLVAFEWVPLYFWMLERTLARPERRWPMLAGLALALASLASWYYLLFCVALTAPYLAYRLLRDAELRRWPALRRALLLGGSYLALLWPLLAAMLEARAAEPWTGSHDPTIFSADLYSFVVPNAAQAIGARFGDVWGRFSGNATENCDYLGYALLALAVAGAVLASRARIWLFTAALGVVLALGPFLRVGGVLHRDWPLPYGWLTRAFPLLDFTGCPVRAGFVASFSLCVAAAYGLARLLEPGGGALLRRGAATALVALAAFEFWPHPFTMSRYPEPSIFRDWANDPTPFAVYDVSGDARPLWNAVLHRHPIVDAYLTRVPERVNRWLDDHPVLGHLRHPHGGLGPAYARRDRAIDFNWGHGSPMPELAPTNFTAEWRGELVVPEDGDYTIVLGADDSGAVSLDGRTVVVNGGTHPYLERAATIPLSRGPHALDVGYRQEEGGAAVRLLWARAGERPSVVPPDALVGPDGQPGLEATYRQIGNTTGLSREEARAALRRDGIRYLVYPAWKREPLLEGELGLPTVYLGEGLRIYEVPGA